MLSTRVQYAGPAPTHLVEKINPNQRSYLHTLSQNRHPANAFPPRVRHILLHPLPRCNFGWIPTLNWTPAVLPPVGRYSRVGFEAISLFFPHSPSRLGICTTQGRGSNILIRGNRNSVDFFRDFPPLLPSSPPSFFLFPFKVSLAFLLLLN